MRSDRVVDRTAGGFRGRHDALPWLGILAVAVCLGAAISLRAESTASGGTHGDLLSHIVIPAAGWASALESGSAREAARLLSEHFAARRPLELAPELCVPTFDNTQTEASYLRDRPDYVLRNRFANLTSYVEAGRDIDWNGRFGRGEPETTWWINRFFFLLCLEEEYARTREARFPRHGIDLMLDWVRKNPRERAGQSWGAWRTLEIGLRLCEWSRFIDRMAAAGVIAPGELATLLGSLREQAEYLIGQSGPGRANWGFMEQLGILSVAVTFPEFRDARRWEQGAIDVYRADVRAQIYPDGSQEELTTHYGLVVVHSLARFVELLQQRGRPVPADLDDALRRAAVYAALTLKPDLSLAMLSDGDALNVAPFLGYLARKLDLRPAQHVLSHGRKGAAPPLCRLFPCSGLAILRDSWKLDARCLIFDTGPFGTRHQHEDALGFDVTAFGRSFIVDPGRYTYVGGPFRDYFAGTRSHATVMIDGGQQNRRSQTRHWRAEAPVPSCFAATERLALAKGEYGAGYTAPAADGVMHRRWILFVDHEYWVIVDDLLGAGRHRVEQCFQYTPGPLHVRGDLAATGHADANLVMRWSWPGGVEARVVEGQKDPPLGWYSHTYGRIAPAPHLTLSADLELPSRIVLVLYPSRGGTATEPSVEVAWSADAATGGVKIVVATRMDRITLPRFVAPPSAADRGETLATVLRDESRHGPTVRMEVRGWMPRESPASQEGKASP